RMLPHEHFIKGVEGSRSRQLKRVWLFVIAIALHNVPEGLAIGVAFAGAGTHAASALALGISIQDIPEGLSWRWPCAAWATAAVWRWVWQASPASSSRLWPC